MKIVPILLTALLCLTFALSACGRKGELLPPAASSQDDQAQDGQ